MAVVALGRGYRGLVGGPRSRLRLRFFPKEIEMKLKMEADVTAAQVEMEGANDVLMKILIGPGDGSDRIIMRLFTVLPGGHTPRHRHDYEHLVKVERGQGVAVDADGVEQPIRSGSCVLVSANEEHQFRNPHSEELRFICVIPNPER